MTAFRCGVLGRPIAHSLSPVLHRAAYRHLGLDGEYQAYDVGTGELAAFLGGLDATWRGLSLTMPLKEEALALAASASSTATTAGGANTLVLDPSGPVAHNTDVPGIVAALDEAGAAGGPALVIGTGATARSAVVALARRGAEAILVVGRREEALASLVDLGAGLEVPTQGRVADALAARDLEVGVVISTIPADAADRMLPDRTGDATLFDVLYDPWPTPLARRWSGPIVGGLDLLVHQAALQVPLMTGHEVPVEVLRAAGARALAERGTSRG